MFRYTVFRLLENVWWSETVLLSFPIPFWKIGVQPHPLKRLYGTRMWAEETHRVRKSQKIWTIILIKRKNNVLDVEVTLNNGVPSTDLFVKPTDTNDF